MTAADTSDQVLSVIAGEARMNPRGIDAVVNNMMNRVGTSGYGPSANLQEVALSQGTNGRTPQYTGRRRPNAKERELILSRIRAVASGGVADPTRGSNEYRADWYHGRWSRRHAGDGINVGGNVFAYNPEGGKGPYSSYDKPRDTTPTDVARQNQMSGGPRDVNLGRGRVDVNVSLDKSLLATKPKVAAADNFDVGFAVDRTGGAYVSRPGDPSFVPRSGAR